MARDDSSEQASGFGAVSYDLFSVRDGIPIAALTEAFRMGASGDFGKTFVQTILGSAACVSGVILKDSPQPFGDVKPSRKFEAVSTKPQAKKCCKEALELIEASTLSDAEHVGFGDHGDDHNKADSAALIQVLITLLPWILTLVRKR